MRSITTILVFLLLLCGSAGAQTAAELALIKEKAEKGDAESQYQLGEYYLDGSHGMPLKDAIAWINKAAEQGLAKAQYKMGYAHTCLWVKPASEEEAMRWYRLAAAQGNVDAFSRLALAAIKLAKEAYLKEDQAAFKEHRRVAMEWYTKAAEAGDRGAQFELAEMYNRMNDFGRSENSRRHGVTDADCDFEAAMKWYLKAAKSKYPHPGAMYRIGMLYLEGKGVTQDTQTAIKWLELASKGGAGWATEELTSLYRSGKLAPKNIAKALELLRAEAESGSHSANRELGLMYYFGEEVPIDFSLAFKYLSAAIERPTGSWDGNVYNILGHFYEEGKVTPRDLDKAFKYHLIGAKAGIPTGQFSVAFAYQFGKGTKINYTEAANWYRLAAEGGITAAQANLGAILMAGIGEVRPDPIEGLKWYKKAAVSGNERAQMGLAIAYHTGHGAPKDYVEAYAWANLAAASGKIERGKELREDIEAKLSPAQISEGQQRSRELNRLINDELENLKQIQKAIELRERMGA
jgi:TPR repeat protein